MIKQWNYLSIVRSRKEGYLDIYFIQSFAITKQIVEWNVCGSEEGGVVGGREGGAEGGRIGVIGFNAPQEQRNDTIKNGRFSHQKKNKLPPKDKTHSNQKGITKMDL